MAGRTAATVETAAKAAEKAAQAGGRWIEPLNPAPDALAFAIKTTVRDPGRNARSGDYFFAEGLAAALARLGHRARIDSAAEYDEPGADIDLLLRGARSYAPRPGRPAIFWVIYPGKTNRITAEELNSAAHVFIASDRALERFREGGVTVPMEPLYQTFDARLMQCRPGAARDGIVFVGNNHFEKRGGRKIVKLAGAAGTPLRLWGRFWKDLPENISLQGEFMPPEEVAETYRHARIVLCDHQPGMRKRGYASNRIFDALACGAAVISDKIVQLPPQIAPHVVTVGRKRELRLAVRRIMAEGPHAQADRDTLAGWMIEHHSFDARARRIVEVAHDL